MARWRDAVLPGILGAALVSLAAPRVALEATLLGADGGVAALERGQAPDMAPDAPAARAFADGLAAAADASGDPRALALAARAMIALARQSPGQEAAPGHDGAPRRDDTLDRARGLQAAALARAPADPYGWQRLAHTLAARQQWLAAAEAWRMGLAVAGFDPALLPVRLESGVALWPFMNAAQRAQFATLAASARRGQPDELRRLSDRFGAVPLPRPALADRAGQ